MADGRREHGCVSPLRRGASIGGHVGAADGGVGGGWSVIFGGWADVGEGLLSLELLVCPGCGKVEMRVPGAPASRKDAGDEAQDRWDAVWQARSDALGEEDPPRL